ncbi:MAG: hypothetical protein NC081_06845 [Roseburia sp.]|nr:hypothetical protein [Roseburia sp.]
MELYNLWNVEELSAEAHAVLQETIDGYYKTLRKMQAAAAPGSVVDVVGIPKVWQKIRQHEEFMRQCDEYSESMKRGAAR